LLQNYSNSWRRVQPNVSWYCLATACASCSRKHPGWLAMCRFPFNIRWSRAGIEPHLCLPLLCLPFLFLPFLRLPLLCLPCFGQTTLLMSLPRTKATPTGRDAVNVCCDHVCVLLYSVHLCHVSHLCFKRADLGAQFFVRVLKG